VLKRLVSLELIRRKGRRRGRYTLNEKHPPHPELRALLLKLAGKQPEVVKTARLTSPPSDNVIRGIRTLFGGSRATRILLLLCDGAMRRNHILRGQKNLRPLLNYWHRVGVVRRERSSRKNILYLLNEEYLAYRELRQLLLRMKELCSNMT